MNKKTLNILSSEVGFLPIKDFKKDSNVFENDDFAIINLSLFVGDITNLKDNTIREFADFKVKINTELLFNKTNEYQNIRIWSSRLDAESYLSMLYVLSLLKNNNYNIKIIFIDDLMYKERNGEEYRIRNLAGCGKEDIHELLQLEKQLTEKEHARYIDEWNTTVHENAPLRIMHNRKLKGISYAFFDKYIFAELAKENQMTKLNLCIQVIVNNDKELGTTSDLIIMTRIDELIVNGKIKIVGKKPLDYIRVGEPLEEKRFIENKYTIVEKS